ncbi:ABC transporter ATP-binding protein [Oricola sp.]|uniref:ABC transporter ATP-binding protein n=1 Tax=Oricola sp. TaxID=1979950 RepID=UPI003BAA6719
MSAQPPILELQGISKAFPGVVANDGIDLAVRPGEIHAILGENGAGKSTLVKIIYGVYQPDGGSVRWQGEETRIRNPAHARHLGIGMVFQHFSLFETLTVAQNVALAISGSLADITRRIRDVGARFGLEVEPNQTVQNLSYGERQRVEIIRCILQNPKLLVLDEPTSVLPPQGIEKLFVTLKALAAEGYSIIFISHKLDEIRALCDSATVLRRGKVTGRVNPADESNESLSRMMIGRDVPVTDRKPAVSDGGEVLRISGLSHTPEDPFAVALDDVDLSVGAGEIVGIAGISGNGQQALISALSGETVLPTNEAEAIIAGGEPVGHLGPDKRRRRGIRLVPEERLGRGAVPEMSLALNAALTGSGNGLSRAGFLNFGAIRGLARNIISGYDVRCNGEASAARSLSGGNLQKYIVGREIDLGPDLLIAAQPTWGVDVGAAAAIRQRFLDLRSRGTGILVVSEELDELMEICDRLYVMFRGRLSPSIAREDADIATIGAAMAGDFAALDRPLLEVAHA